MKLVEYADRDMLAIGLANVLAEELEQCLLTHDSASFVVPGGTTPGPMFDVLSAARLDWARVKVILSDERWVPETSERSNTRLLRERLLVNRADAASMVSFYSGEDAPEKALDGLGARLEPELPISVLLLGMGADMHTASLFPGADLLKEALAADAPSVLAMRAPGAPEPRLTLTAPVLSGAMSTHILITGQEKREALEKAPSLSFEDAPVNCVLPHATIHWAP
jgi:6-phosphogluconolactonase